MQEFTKEELKNEKWEIIEWLSRYSISSLGRVKSLNYKNTKTEKILKPHITRNGYCEYKLYPNEGKRIGIHGHVLVGMAFLGHTSGDRRIVIHHKDENKQNNKLSNLERVTQRYNVSYSKKNKTSEYTGVSLNYGKWRAVIWDGEKSVTLGNSFESQLDAKKSYDSFLEDILLRNPNLPKKRL